jgi:hypothetical protein
MNKTVHTHLALAERIHFPVKAAHASCERSVGTVFQLPNPDAIYSRDEGKREKVVAIPCCLCLRTVHALLRQGEGPLPREGGEQEGRKRLGQQPSHMTSGSARYTSALVTRHHLFPLLVLLRATLPNLSSVICVLMGLDPSTMTRSSTYCLGCDQSCQQASEWGSEGPT